MVEGAALLVMESVSVVRGKTLVLNDVDFSVNGGDLVVVLGKNGAGKSTLLEASAGILRLTSGNVNHSNTLVRHSDGRRSRPPRLGLTLQSGGFCLDEKVIERTRFALTMAGLEARDEWLLERLEEWNLRHRANDSISSLSGGLRRRLGVLCGLIPALASQSPSLVLLDEPFRGLDQGSRKTLDSELTRLLQTGHGIVVVTHDSGMVEMANRIVTIEDKNISEEVVEVNPGSMSESSSLNERQRKTTDLHLWTEALSWRTGADLVPRLAAAFIAFVLIEGMRFSVGLPEHSGWVAALALTPAFVASLARPGALRHLEDSRAGDWLYAQMGKRSVTGMGVAISAIMVLTILYSTIMLDSYNLADLFLVSLGMGMIGLAAASIYFLETAMTRPGAAFTKLLLIVLVWPLFFLTQSLTDTTDLVTDLGMGLGIPTMVILIMHLIASE